MWAGRHTYQEYLNVIGDKGEAESYAPELKAASEWGGTRVNPVEIGSPEELGVILVPETLQEAEAHKDRLDECTR